MKQKGNEGRDEGRVGIDSLSSKRETRYASLASWRAPMADDWNRTRAMSAVQ